MHIALQQKSVECSPYEGKSAYKQQLHRLLNVFRAVRNKAGEFERAAALTALVN